MIEFLNDYIMIFLFISFCSFFIWAAIKTIDAVCEEKKRMPVYAVIVAIISLFAYYEYEDNAETQNEIVEHLMEIEKSNDNIYDFVDGINVSNYIEDEIFNINSNLEEIYQFYQ